VDTSAVKAIVEANIERLMEAIGIPHWRLTVYYEAPENPNWKASCDRSGADYWRASITIDPKHANDADDVIDSLVHELLHIVLAPFDLYRNAVTPHIAVDTPEGRQEQVIWTHVMEQTVLTLERGLAMSLRKAPEDPA
jgi:nitric oxide synthase oxygenase domain/subunit